MSRRLALAAIAVVALFAVDVPTPSAVATTAAPGWPLLAFQGRRGGDYEIYVARPEGGPTRQLTRNGLNDRLPDWSPDGRWILYVGSNAHGVGRSYYVMTADGGRTWRLGRAAGSSSYEWSPDGRRLAFTERGRPGLYVVNADGTGRQAVYARTSIDFEWSPDGRLIAFGCDADLCVVRQDGTGLRTLIRDARNPDWSPDGRRIAFLRRTKRTSGEYVAHVARRDGTSVTRVFPVAGIWSWSPDGRRLAIVDNYDDGDGDYEWVARLGSVRADGSRFRWIYTYEGASLSDFEWSPDGRTIAFDCGPFLKSDVCLADAASGVIRNLNSTVDRGDSVEAWSPAGDRLAYKSYVSGPDVDPSDGTYVLRVSTGASVRVTNQLGDTSWSPDGRWLSLWPPIATPDLYVVRSDGSLQRRVARLALREDWQPRLK